MSNDVKFMRTEALEELSELLMAEYGTVKAVQEFRRHMLHQGVQPGILERYMTYALKSVWPLGDTPEDRRIRELHELHWQQCVRFTYDPDKPDSPPPLPAPHHYGYEERET